MNIDLEFNDKEMSRFQDGKEEIDPFTRVVVVVVVVVVVKVIPLEDKPPKKKSGTGVKKPPEQTQKNLKLRDHSPHRRLSKASENGGRERVVVAQGRRRLRPSPFLFSVSLLRFFAGVS